MKKGKIFWFTGLSGSGKSTVASGVRTNLEARGRSVLVLDGDEVRRLHPKPMGFTEAEIKENNRFIAGLCEERRVFYDAILVPIISPYAVSRLEARKRLEPGFYEIFFSADLECVMRRDTKGLYAKAKKGEIDNLIGYSDSNVYERPLHPDYVVRSSEESPEGSIAALTQFVLSGLNEARESA